MTGAGVAQALREAAAGCTGLPAAHLTRCAFFAAQLPYGRTVLRHALASQLERVDGKAGREREAAAYRAGLRAVDGYEAPAGAEV